MAGVPVARSMVSGWGLSGSDCLPHPTVHTMTDEPLVSWREISALSLDRAEALEAECDELRAEIGAWVHRQAELQAQIALQERRFREAESEWVERFEALEAENARLRTRLDEAATLWAKDLADAELGIAKDG